MVDQLSAHYWDQDDEYTTDGYHCMISGGYGLIPKAVAEGFDQPLDIRLGKVVQEVKIDSRGHSSNPEEGIISIRCRDGTSFECDAAVVTVPLGVLKAKAIKFTPEFPDWKQASIDKLGYGWFNKVVLVFPHRFWNANVDSFGSLGPQQGQQVMPTFESVARGELFLFW